MKNYKFIFNLFPQQDKIAPEIQELAALIGLYNFEQPDNDFINWLINNLSDQYFIFYSSKDNGVTNYDKSIDVHFRGEYRRVGTIESTPVS